MLLSACLCCLFSLLVGVGFVWVCLVVRSSLRDGVGSARVGDEIPILVARGDSCYNRSDTIASNFNTITSNFSRTLFDSTMEGSRRLAAGNQAEQTSEKRQQRRADETGRSYLYLD